MLKTGSTSDHKDDKPMSCHSQIPPSCLMAPYLSRSGKDRWSRPAGITRWLVVLASAGVMAVTGSSQPPAGPPAPADPNQSLRIPANLAEGYTVNLVYVHLMNPSGDPVQDEQDREELAGSFAIQPGGPFNALLAEGALGRVRQLPRVQAAEYRLYRQPGSQEIQIALLVTLQSAEARRPARPAGWFGKGRIGDFPVLWRDHRSLLKIIFNPYVGVYADHHPWLGNPSEFNRYAGMKETPAWMEASAEAGLGGITQVGATPLYLYGAATYLVSTTQGRDTYNSEKSRAHGEMEQGYGGFLVARPGSPYSFNLSAGRQRFSLNRNLLVGHVLGATNAGERAATYLSPRNAHDLVVDARLRVHDILIEGFYADPNELPAADTHTRFAGLNLKYNNNRSVDASCTFLAVSRSDAAYTLPDGSRLTREGLRAVNPHLRWNAPFGARGFWLEGEYARQWNARYEMSAYAYGAWAGYTFTETPWQPGLLYRYSVFSGDDPATPAYERFDGLTGGVQRDWVQGLTFSKLVANRNLRGHRFEVSVKPFRGMEFSVDCYRLSADSLNNLGTPPPLQTYAAGYIGQSFTPTLQWSVGQNLFIQAVADFVIPGEALKRALVGEAVTWQSYQLSLYFFY
jgi:hypothetical protein